MPWSDNATWVPYRCPKCGRFIKNVFYLQNYIQVTDVYGDCSQCGEVHGVAWGSYDELVGYMEAEP